MIDNNISGWQSIKRKLKQVIGVANKVENLTIQRGGTVDSVTFAGDSIKINVQDFPRAKAQGGGGGGGLDGIEIIWADQTSTYIRADDMLANYDPDPAGAGHLYWSLVLTIGTGVFDKTLTYDDTEDLFEDDGATPPVQTKYRFRLITQGVDSEGDPVNTPISMYGQYREVTTCINGEPFQRLAKVT